MCWTWTRFNWTRKVCELNSFLSPWLEMNSCSYMIYIQDKLRRSTTHKICSTTWVSPFIYDSCLPPCFVLLHLQHRLSEKSRTRPLVPGRWRTSSFYSKSPTRSAQVQYLTYVPILKRMRLLWLSSDALLMLAKGFHGWMSLSIFWQCFPFHRFFFNTLCDSYTILYFGSSPIYFWSTLQC